MDSARSEGRSEYAKQRQNRAEARLSEIANAFGGASDLAMALEWCVFQAEPGTPFDWRGAFHRHAARERLVNAVLHRFDEDSLELDGEVLIRVDDIVYVEVGSL